MSAVTVLPVRFAAHAIERYRDRLRPALSIEMATAELEQLSVHSVLCPEGPDWMNEERKDADALFLEIGDAAFPLVASDDGESLVAKTCLVRGSMSPQARDRRNRANRVRRRNRR